MELQTEVVRIFHPTLPVILGMKPKTLSNPNQIFTPSRIIRTGDLFVVQPLRKNWSNDNFKQTEVLPQDFVYTSDKNETWLTKKDIKKIVDQE